MKRRFRHAIEMDRQASSSATASSEGSVLSTFTTLAARMKVTTTQKEDSDQLTLKTPNAIRKLKPQHSDSGDLDDFLGVSIVASNTGGRRKPSAAAVSQGDEDTGQASSNRRPALVEEKYLTLVGGSIGRPTSEMKILKIFSELTNTTQAAESYLSLIELDTGCLSTTLQMFDGKGKKLERAVADASAIVFEDEAMDGVDIPRARKKGLFILERW